jgi:LysM repeat protein
VHRRERALSDGAPVSNPFSANPLHVAVKPGDTLWSIAQRYRVSLKRLRAINQLADNHIQVGQALWLADPSASDASAYETVE